LILIDSVIFMASFSLLFPGLKAGDTISADQDEVSGTEGQSVTLSCKYQTDDDDVALYWYKHHSDLQAPQFILWKEAKGSTDQCVPNNRYESQTSDTSTTLTIRELTLADTALYYCAVETDTVIQSVAEAVQKPEHRHRKLHNIH
uniref:T-cell receptor alpha/delta variable 26.0 n=1 Tax=Stegastes partitus TaxID=144197 RepID=A0A3B5B8R1_9TELE